MEPHVSEELEELKAKMEALNPIEDVSEEELNKFKEQNENISDSDLQRFASVEHKDIGDRAFKAFINDPRNKWLIDKLVEEGMIECTYATIYLHSTLDFTNPNHLDITAGDWVAYGGDFYGIPESPISMSVLDDKSKLKLKNRDFNESKIYFKKAYETLASYPNLTGQAREKADNKLHEIKKGIKDELEVVALAQREKQSVKDFLEKQAEKGNKKYAWATAYRPILNYLPLGYLHSEYIELLQYNVDHFGEQAKQAYAAGHAVAQDTALKAFNEPDPKKKIRIFTEALTQELFACHFLTDLFASGHMRTPRAELLSHVHSSHLFHAWGDDYISRGVIAGFLSEAMHNEDNTLGLEVNSQVHQKPWKSYGDDCYFEAGEETNNLHMQEIIQIALQSIAKVYSTGKIEEPKKDFDPKLSPYDQPYNFLHYIPVPTVNNHPALFIPGTIRQKQEILLTSTRADEFFKKMNAPSNIFQDKERQLSFEHYPVVGDGECGYTAFGITRNDAYQLITDRLNEVMDLLDYLIREALLTEKFITYLKEKNLANTELLTTFDRYNIEANKGGNMDNSVTDNLYIHSTNLKIVQGYIDYDIRDRKIDLGWPHPRILQALAYLREIQLFMWQLDKEGKLIPHRHAEYSLYTPPNVNSRTDLLFINDNHFDRLQLRLNANDGIDKRDDLSKIILLNENNLAPASQNPQVKPLPRNQENDETKEIRHVVLRRAKVHLKEGEVCHHVHDWSPTLLFLKTRPQKMVEAEWQKLRKQFEDKTAQAKNIVVQTTNVLKEAATHSVTKIIEHSSKCSIF